MRLLNHLIRHGSQEEIDRLENQKSFITTQIDQLSGSIHQLTQAKLRMEKNRDRIEKQIQDHRDHQQKKKQP